MSRLLQKMERIFNLTSEEERMLDSACTEAKAFEAGADIIRSGDRPWRSNLLLEGMVCRYRTLDDHGGRQIFSFQYPGDIFDAYSFILEVMDHSIAAVAPSKVAFIPHEKILEIIQHYPRIARALWKETLIDAAVFSEWMTNSRKHSPTAQLAHLICEAFTRLDVVGLAMHGSIGWPITTAHLRDALGLSSDVVEAAMQTLCASGWITLANGTLTILDLEGLKRAGEFDPGYLHLVQPTGPAGRRTPVEWIKQL